MIEPYYADDWCTLYHGDCREILPRIFAPNVVITDPPFNVGKRYGASFRDDLPLEEYQDLLLTAREVCERHAWVTPTRHLAHIATLLAPAHPLIFRRGARGPVRWGWIDQYLMVLVRGKPVRLTRNLVESIRLTGEGYFFREDTYEHPGYTPEPLMRYLVSVMAGAGDVICDPFSGTGTLLCAAKALGRQAVGIEIEQRWCDVAVARLRQESLVMVMS